MKHVLWTTIRDVVFEHYANIDGTLNRARFWLFMSLQLAVYGIVITLCSLIATIPGTLLYAISAAVVLIMVLQFLLCLPTLGALVRRLKDSNNSPWLLLLVLIPFIGAIIVTILLLLPTKQDTISDDSSELPVEKTSSGKVFVTVVLLLAVFIGGYSVGVDRFENRVYDEWTAFTNLEPSVFTTLINDLLDDEEATKVARDLVVNYYSSLRHGDNREAYRILSQRQRERYGTFETWQRSLNPNDLRSIDSIYLSSIALHTVQGEDTPHLIYRVNFEGVEYPQSVKVTVISVDDTWRIESILPYHEEEE